MRFIFAGLLFCVICFCPAAVCSARQSGFVPPEINAAVSDTGLALITRKEAVFENGDIFRLSRYEFPGMHEEKSEPFSFDIPGETISLSYIDDTGGESKWVHLSEIPEALPKTTLYLRTEGVHFVIGVPAVYKKQESAGILEIAGELERPLEIVEGNGAFTVSAYFPANEDYFGETWMLFSDAPLVEWTENAEKQLLVHELSGTRRLSMDGYYFETPGGYEPGGENVLFKHPSCYTGGSFSRFGATRYESDLGYILMKLHAQSQNDMGFYPTSCTSTWLYNDFGIGPDFYDTRWNTDFASNLLDAYEAYGDPEFLARAKEYAEFYMDFAENYSYPTGAGILVSDYWQEAEYTKTHASLNHHVAGLNLLLRFYGVTGDPRYKALAERMLKGVEETESEWIMEDGNLRYALHYEGGDTLYDYPYLTYNDLFICRELLKKHLGKTSPAIQSLMDSKLGWMRENGISGYLGWS